MKKILSAILALLLSSGFCQAEDTLAKKLWDELEAAKLPKEEREVEVKEELGPSDLAFLEDQLPTPQGKDKEEAKEVMVSDFGSLTTETDEVSLGQAAPIRRNNREGNRLGKTTIRKRKERTLFRERSRGEEAYIPIEFTPPKMRKRSH